MEGIEIELALAKFKLAMLEEVRGMDAHYGLVVKDHVFSASPKQNVEYYLEQHEGVVRPRLRSAQNKLMEQEQFKCLGCQPGEEEFALDSRWRKVQEIRVECEKIALKDLTQWLLTAGLLDAGSGIRAYGKAQKLLRHWEG